jgi:hypothetical protein
MLAPGEAIELVWLKTGGAPRGALNLCKPCVAAMQAYLERRVQAGIDAADTTAPATGNPLKPLG